MIGYATIGVNDLERAKGFYDKHGYFVFDRFEGYYNNSLDAFVMMKTAKR